MAGALTVLAPVSGSVVPLETLPDPVFAESLVGPGTALLPAPGTVQVLAPVSGVVVVAHPHAFVVAAGDRAVLVHLGLDTVALRGAGFASRMRRDQPVRAGEPVATWDTSPAVRQGLPLVCPVIALGGVAADVDDVAGAGAPVRAGDPLLVWGQASLPSPPRPPER